MTEYTLIRSDRKTLALELKPTGELVVRAPRRLPRSLIDRAVAEREDWIEAKRAALAARPPEPDGARIEAWRAEAKRLLPDRGAYWSRVMELYPRAVKITAARTRWGSCSAGGNINLSCRLMGKPPAAVDYVIVHELAHLRHMDHSAAFYRLVARYLPDYKERIKLLK
jgi:predicted metal-dependent hydrolase